MYAVRDMCGFGVSMLAYDVFIIVSVVGWMIAHNPVYALASLFSMPLLAVFAISTRAAQARCFGLSRTRLRA